MRIGGFWPAEWELLERRRSVMLISENLEECPVALTSRKGEDKPEGETIWEDQETVEVRLGAQQSALKQWRLHD